MIKMNLPTVYPITLNTKKIIEPEFYLDKLTNKNLNFFQYRRKEISHFQVLKELDILKNICRNNGISLIINSYHGKELANNFRGLHLTSEDSKQFTSRPISKHKLLGISCHSKDEIVKAKRLEADYLFLSPVRKPQDKEMKSLGWTEFSKLAKETNIPSYALGGMNISDLHEAQENGDYGIAGIRKFWSY